MIIIKRVFNMKKLILTFLFMLISSTTYANGLHDIQSNIGEDKFAHAGMSYIVCDQLQRNAGFNPFWAGFTTLAIGFAKEKLIDNHFDAGDMIADTVGVWMYQVKF